MTNKNNEINENIKSAEINAHEAEAVKKQAEEHSDIDNLPKDLEKSSGILIYESARKKLNISDDGKIYRQKWFNYLPFVSMVTIIAYVNFVFGKTKCLKDNDFRLFKKANIWCNIVCFLIMPIVGMGLWTFGAWMVTEVIPDSYGSYSDLWHSLLIDKVNAASEIQDKIALAFSGLFQAAIIPLAFAPSVNINGTNLPLNLIFIAIFALFTIINPVNIILTFIMNAKTLRFITVHESSSIYRYRN